MTNALLKKKKKKKSVASRLSGTHPGALSLSASPDLSPKLLRRPLPGRRLDLHGADGHLPRQVLQAGDREGHEDPRGHPGKDRRLGAFPLIASCSVM